MKNNHPTSLSIYMVGDIFVSTIDNPSFAFANVTNLLKEADITLANVEGVICDEHVSPIPGKSKLGTPNYIRWPPEAVQALLDNGIGAVSIANNHSGDFGDAGVLQELEILDKARIPHAGGGRNLDEAHQPCIINRNGYKIALLAYTCVYIPISFPATACKPGAAVVEIGTAYEVPFNIRFQPGTAPRILTYPKTEDKQRLIEDIQRVRNNVDFVVVGFHWGVSRRGNARSLKVPVKLCSIYTLDYQEDLARASIDAGADLIWGHHPHELQGMEIYKGKLICYSLGNFAFDHSGVRQPDPENFGRSSDASIIVKCKLGPDMKWRYSYLPVRLELVEERSASKPRILNLKEGSYILSDIIKIHSQKYGTKFVEEGNEVLIR